MVVQWVYSEYLSIYTQYLIYFASVLTLLTSASAISLIKACEERKCWVIAFFVISLVFAVADLYSVFEIYDWLRTTLLSMSDQCVIYNGEMACDMDIQDHSSYLKYAIIAMLFSFGFLVLGYLIKVMRHGNKQNPV